MIPESLSFAILAGFPLVGLYAAFIMGLVTAVLVVGLEWYQACRSYGYRFDSIDEV
jgi:hypothetical protein